MKISGITKNLPSKNNGYGLHTVKNITTKTKNTIKQNEFMKTPLKYSAIGFLLPIPLASPIGFALGLGVATIKKIVKKKNLHKP